MPRKFRMYLLFALTVIIVLALAALAFAVFARCEPRDGPKPPTREPSDDGRA